jgi:type I restriction enzyme, S subunit
VSRIEELMAAHCPNGVPFQLLGAAAPYSETRIDATELDETTFIGVDNLLSEKGGKVNASYLPNTQRLTAYQKGDVLLGNIRPYLKKVWLATNGGGCSGDVLALRVSIGYRDRMLPEFLYYLLSSDGFFAYDIQHSKGGKMPRGDKASILKYRIPIPPIEVQREVVRVLDLFQSLEAELDAELNARRLQYAHYRDSLVSFPKEGIRWAPLGKLGNVHVGQAPPEGVVSEEGPFAFVNAGTTESGRALQANTPGGAVTIPSRGQGGVGVVGYQAEDFWCGPLCYRIVSADAELSTRFLYYYLKSVQPSIRGLQQTGGTPALNRKELILVKIPMPPLQEQERIVGTLDKFDALVNDLSIGLPAELTARRKQYEYYRDRLLTFQELAT